MVSETWESFVKLPHDVTLTMEQVSSECGVHGSTSVGFHLPAAPWLSVGVDFIRVSTQGKFASGSFADLRVFLDSQSHR